MECNGKVSNNSLLVCDHIAKTFETKDTNLEVLKDISIDVAENEFVVLLGPGQCGKTTLVNIMAGLEPASAGEICFRGKPIINANPKLAVVYQTLALFPWKTVMQNVEFGPKMRRIGRAERRKRAQYFIDLVGLTGFENSFPAQLSGGMRQRAGIARAYCNDPDVLLMDEPFGHLDAQTRYSMQEAIEQIWSKEKRAVLFITNNIEEGVYLADRIIVLTNSPTVIKSEVVIDLPRPRDYVSPEFLAYRSKVSEIFESEPDSEVKAI